MLSSLRTWRESLTPASANMDFRATGQISPEEFVAAGVYLCHQFPTWSWAADDSSLVKRDFLPQDKQYLVCKDVPCVERARDIGGPGSDPASSRITEEEADEDGFVQTSIQPAQGRESLYGASMASSAREQQPATASSATSDDFVLTGREDETAHTTTIQTRTYDLFITYDKYYRTPRLCESMFQSGIRGTH